MKTKLVVVMLVVLVSFRSEAQNRVEVVVKDVKDATGIIRVGLFADEKSFLKEPLIGKLVKASGGDVTVVFENVPNGGYAISTIHDSNENGELDSNLFGMPKEGFGFSNDAMGTFGPPSFEKAKFVVSASIVVTVKTRYL